MKIERVEPASGPVVTHIGPSGFRTRDALFARGLILLPASASDWEGAPASAEALTVGALDPLLVLSPPPEFILFGSGDTIRFPPPGVRAALDERGIGLEVMDSRTAARAWALLRAEDRWIGAALLPPGQ